MNRMRLSNRLARMAKLLELNAPRTIILSEWRMACDAFIDCEQHGYESDVTNNALRRQQDIEVDAAEAAHLKHMDGKPDPDCDFCQLEDTLFNDQHPDPERGS